MNLVVVLQDYRNKDHPPSQRERMKTRPLYRQRNREPLRPKRKEYRERNSELLRAKRKEYRGRNREPLRAKRKEHCQRNRENISARRKAARQRHLEKFKEKENRRKNIRKKTKHTWIQNVGVPTKKLWNIETKGSTLLRQKLRTQSGSATLTSPKTN